MGRWYVLLPVVLLVAACGGGSGEPTATAPASPTGAAPSTTSVPSPTPTPEPPTFLYFVAQGPYGSVIQQVSLADLDALPEELPIQLPYTDVALNPRGDSAAVAPPGLEPADVLLFSLTSPFTQENLFRTPDLDESEPFFSADGNFIGARVANSSDGLAIHWEDLATRTDKITSLGDIDPQDLRWLPDGTGFSYVLEGAAMVYKFDTGQHTFHAEDDYEVLQFAFSPDGQRAAVIQVERRPPTPTPSASQTPTDTPASETETPEPSESPGDAVTPTPEHQPEWRLSVIDEKGLVVATLAPGFTGLGELRWQSDGGDLVTFTGTDRDGQTGLWAISPGRSPQLVYKGRVDDSAWSPDGRYVALVGDGGECSARTCPRGFLRVVDLETGKVYRWDASPVLSRPAWGVVP